VTARAFLVRGLLAGLIAGVAAFIVAYTVGEPHVQRAIDIEESSAAQAPDSSEHAFHASTAAFQAVPTHDSHEEDGTVVSRHNQRTWGLLTGSLGVGTALGGIVALVAAGIVGRVGRWSPGQSVAFVALAGWISVALVPFLKYPANPPAVGNADTIGDRTTEYFIYLLISIAAAVAATALGQRLWRDRGAYIGVLAGVALYLVLVVVAGLLMPTVNEVGDFPADTLWYFRRASILTQATMWAVIGIVLTGLVGRLYRQTTTAAERRALAASL
jgi:predicted cobalt transporter CbtA